VFTFGRGVIIDHVEFGADVVVRDVVRVAAGVEADERYGQFASLGVAHFFPVGECEVCCGHGYSVTGCHVDCPHSRSAAAHRIEHSKLASSLWFPR